MPSSSSGARGRQRCLDRPLHRRDRRPEAIHDLAELLVRRHVRGGEEDLVSGEAVGLRLVDELRGDVSYAFRLLRRSPAFTLVALLSLGLAVIFGLINAIIRPIVKLLTLPLLVLTLGLFAFVVNALMLLLTSWICDVLDLPFKVEGFWSALLGALVISVVTFLINLVLPDEYER